LLYLAEEELTRQNCSCRATQLPSAENNTWDLIAQTSSELQQVQIATCPVDRRNQIQLIGQLSGETTSELPLVTDCPSDQGKWKKKHPGDSPAKLSNKKGSTLSHIAQNIKLEKRQRH
jgi:hypothetical protein